MSKFLKWYIDDHLMLWEAQKGKFDFGEIALATMMVAGELAVLCLALILFVGLVCVTNGWILAVPVVVAFVMAILYYSAKGMKQ